MKRSLSATILFASLLFTCTSHAKSTDWTPYVKGIKNNCNNDKIHSTVFSNDNKPKTIPRALQPSIQEKIITNTFDESIGYPEGNIVTLHLKNAVAFNQPLDKIEIYGGQGKSHVKLYFQNTKFMSLIPQFTVSDGVRKEKAGTEHFWIHERETQYRSETSTFVKNHKKPYAKDADRNYWSKFYQSDRIEDRSFSTYFTSKTGYRIGHGGYDHSHHEISLIFDNKNKSISCIDYVL